MTAAASRAPSTSPVPRSGPGLLVGAGLLLIMLVAAIGTRADADLWGHLRFGGDIVASGSIVQPDRYSFTSDRPWVNHEWLSELLFFLAYRQGGSVGLIAFKLLVIAGLCGLLWWRLRRVAVAPGATLALVVLAFVGTYWRTHSVRPQLFSVLFFALLLLVMTEADAGRRRGLVIVPVLMALWVNLHGGWIVGLGVLGFWTAVRVCDWRRWRDPGRRRDQIELAITGVAALVATLANPYGPRLWMFLAETVRFGRADIEEWGSILTYPVLLGVPWGLLLLAGVLAIWRSGWPRRMDYVLLLAGLAIASFRVSRLDAFFSLAVVILLAPQIVDARRSIGQMFTNRGPVEEARDPGGPSRGVLLITALAMAAMLVPAAAILRPYATCLSIDGPWVPEPEAGAFIAQNHLEGRMLTWFDWGEYAIWHFGPGLQVSLDGRRETVYTDSMIQAHRRFYAGDETALPFLRKLDPDFVWLPVRLPIVSQLGNSGWQTVFRGSTSVVLARAGSGPFHPVRQPLPSARCFPGP